MLEQFPDSVRELFQTPRAGGNSQIRRPGFPPFALVAAAVERFTCWKRLRWRRSATASASKSTTVATTGITLRAADYLLERLRGLRKKSERVCLISGGEVTVKVANGGTGGRNQQFALACAAKIAGEAITVLSAGTDGIDGNSPAAGSDRRWQHPRTCARPADWIRPRIWQASMLIPFFEALGDAIVTGPTGNNLRDLRILLAY